MGVEKVTHASGAEFFNFDTGFLTHSSSKGDYVIGNRVKSGAQNRDYRVQIAKHQDATTNYSRSDIVPSSWGHISVATRRPQNVFGQGWERSDGWPIVHPTVASASDSVLADQALARIKGKMQSEAGNINILAPLGELKDLGSTIRSTIDLTTTFLGFMRNLVTGRGSGWSPRKLGRFAGGAWLDWSFGINPMIQDGYAIADSIEAWKNRTDHFKRFTGTAKKSWTDRIYSSNVIFNASCVTDLIERREHTLEYKYIAGVYYNVESGNDYSAFKHFGVVPQNIIPTLWQLLPWSWLIDYYTTAGAVLNDTFLYTPGDTIYALANKRYTILHDISVKSITPKKIGGSQWYKTFEASTPLRARSYSFTRNKLLALPARQLRFKTTDEVANHGIKKLLNLLSLILTR